MTKYVGINKDQQQIQDSASIFRGDTIMHMIGYVEQQEDATFIPDLSGVHFTKYDSSQDKARKLQNKELRWVKSYGYDVIETA